VTDWTLKHDRDEILQLCDKGQVPCGPLLSIAEIFEDPQYAARGNIARISHPVLGELALPAVVPRLTETPGRIASLGPALGQDTETILTGLLGRTAVEVGALRAKGVV
jgi:crotonobetainyl-CoA:carnitine CoA-transferase CaiB-like acyl-CoA transferase